MNTQNAISRRLFFKQAVAVASLGLVAPLALGSLPGTARADSTERTSVSFDLTKPGTQETTIVLPDGTESIFGVEVPEISTCDGYSESLGTGYGDFKTYWYTGLLNISYWIRVDNYAISYCYKPFAGGLEPPLLHVVVDWTDLDWGSYWCRMATHYHESGWGNEATKFIEGRINGTTITYSFWTV